MNRLYIITGPAGVGKSTISRKVAESLEKSVLIEGDDIYNQFVGGRISPWLDNAPIDLFWNNMIMLINNYLESGYDVVINYIINKDKFHRLKDYFKEYDIKFMVLLVDEEILVERDKLRPIDCRMGERCKVLLNEFKEMNYDTKYILDTTNLNIEEVVDEYLSNDRFIIDNNNTTIDNDIKIIEYEDKYIEDVRDLLVELEEYIVSIDKDKLDIVGEDYREKVILYDLEEVKNNSGKMYLAIKDNKAIGMIAGIINKYEDEDYLDYKCPKKGEITELVVSEIYRSNGVGNMLMNKLEKYFRSLNCEYITVDVFGYNDRAYNFYKRKGYHTRMNIMIKKLD